MVGVDSAAKKKRRAFTVKSGDQLTHIYCIRHPSEVATFYCAVCGKPHDEACVGREEGENTICRSCALEHSKPERKGPPKWLPIVLAVIALVISAANSAYYYMNQPQRASVTEPPRLTKQVQDIILCRQRLEYIAQEAAFYHKSFGDWPGTLALIEPLFEDKTMLIDPLTLQPFALKVENGSFTVHAPVPEAYGLKALYAVPEKPAKMEYLGNGA